MNADFEYYTIGINKDGIQIEMAYKLRKLKVKKRKPTIFKVFDGTKLNPNEISD